MLHNVPQSLEKLGLHLNSNLSRCGVIIQSDGSFWISYLIILHVPAVQMQVSSTLRPFLYSTKIDHHLAAIVRAVRMSEHRHGLLLSGHYRANNLILEDRTKGSIISGLISERVTHDYKLATSMITERDTQAIVALFSPCCCFAANSSASCIAKYRTRAHSGPYEAVHSRLLSQDYSLKPEHESQAPQYGTV